MQDSNTTSYFRSEDPIQALLDSQEPAVLAVIAGVEGPSYRPIGAMMAVLSSNNRVGTLSSGCIESDIALHAAEAAKDGNPRMLRYGRGSPYIDIQLPCGGGLDILLLPAPDKAVLEKVLKHRTARVPCSLSIDIKDGAMQLVGNTKTNRTGSTLVVRFEPAIRFLIFGKGPETTTFAALTQSAGYTNVVFSPDTETLDHTAIIGCETKHLTEIAFPKGINVDDRTAIVLFFHDHEWEPPLLVSALETPAFYIGAQGSQRARDLRLTALESMGISVEQRTRLHGPIGLIPSARDPQTLAVSVLAEVLAKSMAKSK